MLALSCALLAALAGLAAAQQTRLTGNLSLVSRYTPGPTGTWAAPRAFDLGSDSRFVLTRGRSRLTATFNRPLSVYRYGQPDRYFTLEAVAGPLTARYGDFSPSFPNAATGFTRVSGAEAKVRVGRVAEVTSLRGTSRAAVQTAGWLVGSYRQTVTGERLVITPSRALSVGASALRYSDDPGSGDFTGSYYRPRAKDDLLLGTDVNLGLPLKARLSLDYVASFYTGDRSASSTGGALARDHGRLAWIADNRLVRALGDFNDSTRAGELVAGKLTAPVGPTSASVEYRRTSRTFASLASPYEAADTERLRVFDTARLFRGRGMLMASADYSRSNLSKTQPYTTRGLTLFLSGTLTTSALGQLSANAHAYRRGNDAPAPDSGAIDRRFGMRVTSLNLSLVRNARLGSLPLAVSGTASTSQYGDAIRPASRSTTGTLQLAARLREPRRTALGAQLGVSSTLRPSPMPDRTSAQLLLTSGYHVLPRRLRLSLSEGVSTGPPSTGGSNRIAFAYGAGLTWTRSPTSEVDLEWRSTDLGTPFFAGYGRRQQSFDLRLSYGLEPGANRPQ